MIWIQPKRWHYPKPPLRWAWDQNTLLEFALLPRWAAGISHHCNKVFAEDVPMNPAQKRHLSATETEIQKPPNQMQ